MNIHFGVDYYPEHWSKARWRTDVELMQQMGIQVVRMAEFSWYKMESQEGVYDFEWLDEVIGLLGSYGIKTVLGTPSAAPPAWLVNKYPEVLPVDVNGHVRGFGGRHHTCHSNTIYRELVSNIVTALAKRYGDNTNVIGWQPDNELGNSHQDLCTCDSCRRNFQKWLSEKYSTVEQLNKAWGTDFWSQGYNQFEEVFTPRLTAAGKNPSAILDWKCFCSDLIVDFFKEQAEIIREYCPTQFITHNYMGFANKVDYYDLGKHLDFISHDQYPGLFLVPDMKNNHKVAASLDVIRSYKNQPFWIMEQQSGIIGWQIMGKNPEPGQLSMWTLQSIAHGADAIVFFRWRTCVMGTEQYWHGILPHSGIPGRRYYELQDMMKEMLPIMKEMQGSMPSAEVGIVFSFRQSYAIEIQPHHPKLEYIEQIQKYYKAFYDKNIIVDFVPEDGDFSKYKLLVAPLQYLMTDELEEKYFTYVKNGGHLLLTMRTGVKEEHNICMSERELPGKLSELVGVEVSDYDCLVNTKVKIDCDGRQYWGNIWSDILKKTNPAVKVLASYSSEFYKGEACITENSYKYGIAYYVGTEPDEKLMTTLADYILHNAEVESIGEAEEDVELAVRENSNKKWLFALNHTNKEKRFKIDNSYHIIKGNNAGFLRPYEVQIFEKTR